MAPFGALYCFIPSNNVKLCVSRCSQNHSLDRGSVSTVGANRVKRVIYPGFVTNLTKMILGWTVPMSLFASKLT